MLLLTPKAGTSAAKGENGIEIPAELRIDATFQNATTHKSTARTSAFKNLTDKSSLTIEVKRGGNSPEKSENKNDATSNSQFTFVYEGVSGTKSDPAVSKEKPPALSELKDSRLGIG